MSNHPQDPVEYGIRELAELGGVSRRTVRYYVERGLLPAPTGTGRGKHYTRQHLETLVRVRELQEQGVPLDRIVAEVEDGSAPGRPISAAPARQAPAESSPTGVLWERVRLVEGVELHLRAGRFSPLQVAAVRAAVARALGAFPLAHGQPTKKDESP